MLALQDIVRTDLTVKNKKFNEVKNIVSFNWAKETNGRIHFLGSVRMILSSRVL